MEVLCRHSMEYARQENQACPSRAKTEPLRQARRKRLEDLTSKLSLTFISA